MFKYQTPHFTKRNKRYVETSFSFSLLHHNTASGLRLTDICFIYKLLLFFIAKGVRIFVVAKYRHFFILFKIYLALQNCYYIRIENT